MDSTYQQYLDTNYAPTVDEAQHIESIVGKSAKEHADIVEKIVLLRQQIYEFHEKREKIRTFSDRHQALLSPMRKLGRDVLEEIFLACLPIDRNPCMSTTEAPMLLTHVCSLWREIALTAPRIWAKIHIALPTIQIGDYYDDEDINEQREKVLGIIKLRETAVKDWIRRSQTCSLSISIYQAHHFLENRDLEEMVYPICRELRGLHVQFMRNTIIPHHNRWRDFDIFAADDTLCGFLDSGLSAKDLPMLKTFHVNRLEDFSPNMSELQEQIHRWKDLITLMPSGTTSATLHSFPIISSDISSISRVHFWGNLTYLALKLVDKPTLRVNGILLADSVLRHCHSLITLKLIIWSDRSNASELGHRKDIILQHLTKLTITIPFNEVGLAFAKRLYLPSINDLGFQCSAGPWDRKPEAVKDMVTSLVRASDDLRVLRMYTPYWISSPNDLIQLLKVTPALRCLQIISKGIRISRWKPLFQETQRYYNEHIFDNILQKLTPTGKSDSDIICPKLEVITYEVSGARTTETRLKEFWMARASDDRVSSLRRIFVSLNQPKQKHKLNTGTVSLGNDSRVYFKRPEPNPRFSPFEGIDDNSEYNPLTDDKLMEYYTEL